MITEKKKLMKKKICPRCKTKGLQKKGMQVRKVLRCASCGWTRHI